MYGELKKIADILDALQGVAKNDGTDINPKSGSLKPVTVIIGGDNVAIRTLEVIRNEGVPLGWPESALPGMVRAIICTDPRILQYGEVLFLTTPAGDIAIGAAVSDLLSQNFQIIGRFDHNLGKYFVTHSKIPESPGFRIGEELTVENVRSTESTKALIKNLLEQAFS
jgi:hypothetical protein